MHLLIHFGHLVFYPALNTRTTFCLNLTEYFTIHSLKYIGEFLLPHPTPTFFTGDPVIFTERFLARCSSDLGKISELASFGSMAFALLYSQSKWSVQKTRKEET